MDDQEKRIKHDKLQKNMILALLSYDEYVGMFISHMEPDYFNLNASRIIQCFKKFYARFSKRPTKDIMFQMLEKQFPDPETLSPVEDYLADCFLIEHKTDDGTLFLDWVSEESKTYIKYKAIEAAVIESVDSLRDMETCPEQVISNILKCTEISFDDDLGINYFEDLAERMAWTCI